MAFDFLCITVEKNKRPLGVKWRSSVWFVTFVVFLSVFIDCLVYSIIIPVIPFRLEALGHPRPSALAGWLLFAYSVCLVLATPPLAYLSERYWSRRTPLITAILLLIGSQVIFMEANMYWLMCVARVLQGISSAAVWVISLSLLCDTVPEKQLGQQLGIVNFGISLGYLVGPTIGGVLNQKLGYRAPFVASIFVAVLDLIGRLLVVEKSAAKPWLDSSRNQSGIVSTESGANRNGLETSGIIGDNGRDGINSVNATGTTNTANATNATDEASETNRAELDTTTQVEHQSDINDEEKPRSQLSVIKVLISLVRSKRAFMALVNVFVYGILLTIIEPTLPLRLQELYGYASLKVGVIYLGAVVPALFSTPLSGWLSDRIGTAWVTIGTLVFSLPWWITMAIRGPVALLVVSLLLADFFLAAMTTPLTTELAIASKEIPGIGYAHVFGAFIFSYSCASVVGPLTGGQIYAHVKNGWVLIMGLCSGLIVVGMIAAFYGVGEVPLYTQLLRRMRRKRGSTDGDNGDEEKRSRDCAKTREDNGIVQVVQAYQ